MTVKLETFGIHILNTLIHFPQQRVESLDGDEAMFEVNTFLHYGDGVVSNMLRTPYLYIYSNTKLRSSSALDTNRISFLRDIISGKR